MQPSTPSQRDTILLIDDEAIIRTAVAEYLLLSGYAVLAAEDGREGLEIFRQKQDQIILVLLDVTMPFMSGTEVLRHIRELSADVPIILLSGLHEPEDLAEMIALPSTTFMRKPFRLSQLVETINAIVNP
jgi:DNA-binding response OmpR family regulator